jgi:CDGSH-type Zn-finger protein
MSTRRPSSTDPAAAPATSPADSPAATIVPYEDGPLIVRGDFSLLTPDGEAIETGRNTIALCRCGKSTVKPFCDGTHKKTNFKAGSGRETPPTRD